MAAQRGFPRSTTPSHTIMTPAYTPNRNGACVPPAYTAQSRNAVTRSVVYTPFYNYEQQFQSQAGDNNGDRFLITSPSSPAYSPISPKYTPSAPLHVDTDIFSPCYKPESECADSTNSDYPRVASGASSHKYASGTEASNNKLLSFGHKPHDSIEDTASSKKASASNELKDRITNNVSVDVSTTYTKRSKEQRGGFRRIEYDPCQPQYSLTYDPDPFHLLNDEEYNPLFPAFDN